MCLFYAYVYVFYDFTFCLSVLFSLFCKHVRLSCVFLNKLTYLLTYMYGPILVAGDRMFSKHLHDLPTSRRDHPRHKVWTELTAAAACTCANSRYAYSK